MLMLMLSDLDSTLLFWGRKRFSTDLSEGSTAYSLLGFKATSMPASSKGAVATKPFWVLNQGSVLPPGTL
jgi:hypothetical protein